MPHMPSLPDPAHLSDLFQLYPANIQALMSFTDGVLRGDGELSIGERELIAAFVSGLNACDFCFQSHNIYANLFGIKEGLVEGLLNDIATSDVADRLKPIFLYVKKLNNTPAKLVPADSSAIYEAGWTERALFEAVQVCALFNMMNRIVEGSGVNFDYREHPEMHFASSGNREKQTHSYSDYGKRIGVIGAKKT